MPNDMKEELKNTEMLMLAQFIDVIDVISNNEEFWTLNLSKQDIIKKVKKCQKIHNKNNVENDVYLAYKLGLIDGMKVKDKCI